MKSSKILGLSLAGIMLLSAPAFATEVDTKTENVKPVPISINLPQPSGQNISLNDYAKVVGTVKEIKDYEAVPGSKFITLESIDGEISNIIVSQDTNVMNNAEITIGSEVMAYYDANAPMIMIYPPQYNAKAVVVANNDTPVDVSKMEIIVNGQKIEAPAAYANEAGKIMVPLRAIAEALGYEVKLDGNTIFIGKGVSLAFGKDYYTFAKMAPIQLGTAPELINHQTTYVPLSFFTKVMQLNNAYVFESQIVVDNIETIE